MNATDLLAWQNLVYLTPFGLALLLLLVQAFGLQELGGDDADLETDLETDLDMDAEADLDGDGDERSLDFLGIGKVPMTISLMSLCFLFGSVGWIVQQVLTTFLGPSIAFLFSFVAAVVIACLGTAILNRLIAKYMPASENHSIRNVGELSGLVATALYRVTSKGGWASVRDQFGTLHEVRVRLSSEQDTVPAGSRIVLLEYDEEKNCFSFETEVEFLNNLSKL